VKLKATRKAAIFFLAAVSYGAASSAVAEQPLAAKMVIHVGQAGCDRLGGASFANGFAEDLAMTIADSRTLSVRRIAHAQSMRVTSKRFAIEEGAGIALVANISCDESSRITLDASLVSLLADRKKCNISFAESSDDLFELNALLEDRILALCESGKGHPGRQVPDSKAYAQYLPIIGNEDSVDWQRRVRELANIVGMDDTYAAFWAQLGEAQLRLAESGPENAETRFADAEASLLKSLSLRPTVPFANHALASVYMRVGRTEEAAMLLLDAINSRPAAAELRAKLAYTYRYAGLLDWSINEYQIAATLDNSPQNVISVAGQIAKSEIYLGRYESALETYANIRRLLSEQGAEPDEKTLFYEGLAHLYNGDRSEAVRFFDAARRFRPNSVWTRFALAYKQAALGRNDQLVEMANQLESDNVKDGERRYRLVHFYALAGDTDKANDHLAAALAAGNFNFPYSSRDPFLESIRTSSRYDEVMLEMERRHKRFAAAVKRPEGLNENA
jgi:tetratricopeptide (TPR) repeat protein